MVCRQVLKSKTLTKERFDSVLTKAQEQGELVIDAKAELGKLIVDTPKGNNAGSNQYRASVPSGNESKKSTYTNLGITHKQASNYQTIANHPEAVEKAKSIAKENNDIKLPVM